MEPANQQASLRELWERISSIFADLTEIPREQREDYIRRHCADSPTVEQEVRRLLEAHDESSEFLEEPILGSGGDEEDESHAYREGDLLAGRFRVLRLLGSGGMGEVYEALDSELREHVAIKTLRLANSEDPKTSERFRTEVLRSRQITHPNVCRVYDLFTHPLPEGREAPFFTMELLKGSTLAQWIEEHGPMTPAQALPLLRQMAEALGAAHRVGLVHRDFKPGNIFLTHNASGDLEAIVTDFGIAGQTGSRLEGAKTESLGSSLSMLAGTPAYMSPEQMAGESASAATDVYALGLVAYEMLTGRRLHEGDTPLACTLRRINNKQETLPDSGTAIPKRWVDAIQRCLVLKPAERFQTPHQFLEALAPPAVAPARVRRQSMLIAAAVCLVLLAVSFVVLGRFAGPAANTASIAVLSFNTPEDDPQMAFLGAGFAEELAHTLTSYPKLHVAAPPSAYRFKPGATPWPDIGKQLGVNLIVTGSVRRLDNRMRVAVQLIEASTGRQRWSQIYDRDYRQVFAVQSEITNRLVEMMSVRGGQQRQEREPTANMQAYDHYLKGRFFWNKRSPQDLVKGLEHFEQAVKMDPNFAAAHTGIADSYLIRADYGLIPALEAQPMVRQALKRSLELDPDLAETHATLGLFSSLIEWDQAAAERAFQRALSLKPSLMRAHFWYGVHLMRAGRLGEALREAEIARRLDPVSLATLVFVGWVHYYKHDFDAAIEVGRQASEMEKTYPHAYQLLAQSYAAQGKSRDAMQASELALQDDADEAVKLRRRALVLCALPAKRTEAREVAARLEALSSQRQAGYMAIVYAGLGERDKLYEWMDRAMQVRDTALTLLNIAPGSERFRQEPRFQQALRQVGF